MLFSQAASINLCAIDAPLQHLATRALCVASIHPSPLIKGEFTRLAIDNHPARLFEAKRTKAEKFYFSFVTQD